MTASLLSQWTVQRLNSHLNPSSTGESSTAKKGKLSSNPVDNGTPIIILSRARVST